MRDRLSELDVAARGRRPGGASPAPSDRRGGNRGPRHRPPGTRSKDAGPIVRTFGSEGGYRTEVTSQSLRTLSEEDRRQVSLLMAQVFSTSKRRVARSTPNDTREALKEVNKGRRGDQGHPRHAAQGHRPHPYHGARRQGDLRRRARRSRRAVFPSTRGCCTPRRWHLSWRPGAMRWTSPGSTWSSPRRSPRRSSPTLSGSKGS